MKFTSFLLDQWLQQQAGAEFNLGGSTGPRWTPRQLLALDGKGAAEELLDLELDYPPANGSSILREAIAAMQGVPAEEVVVLAVQPKPCSTSSTAQRSPARTPSFHFHVFLRTRRFPNPLESRSAPIT